MKKLKEFAMKIISSITVFGLILSIIGMKPISAAEIQEFDGDYFYLVQEGNKVTMTDKESGETVFIEIEDINNAILTLEDGTITDYQREAPILKPTTRMGVPIPDYIDPSKFSYTYFQTTYTDTKTQGDIESIALGLLSFMPYFGGIFGIIGIIETARNLGAKTIWIKTKEYYAQGYMYYKYHSYFYTNSKYKNHFKDTINYVKMW